MADSNPAVRTLNRGIDILFCLAGADGPLSLSQVSDRTGLDKATVYRLLLALAARNLVWREDEPAKYTVAPGVLRLAAQVFGGCDLRSVAKPYMERLAGIAEESVAMAILSDGKSVLVDRVESTHELRWVPSMSLALPLHIGAAARAMLAFLPSDEQEAAIAAAALDNTTLPHSYSTEELCRTLAAVRSRGVSFSFSERYTGLTFMAAPILAHGGRPAGALTIGGPDTRFTQSRLERCRGPLLDATCGISRQLGWMSGPDAYATKHDVAHEQGEEGVIQGRGSRKDGLWAAGNGRPSHPEH